VADPSTRSPRAAYGHIHLAFQDFHCAYLRHFGAVPSIDHGYVDDAGLVTYAAAVEHQFGLVCDLAGVPEPERRHSATASGSTSS
jgi:hypothetical protein